MTAPRRLRHRLIALIVLAGWANAGCSFLFVDGPPAKHQKMPYFECTSGRGWPIVDTVIGVSVGLGAAAAIDEPGSQNRSEAFIAAAEAALFLASTVYGFSKTSECREAKEALLLRLGRMSPENEPPDPWAPPPGTPRAPARPANPADPWAPPPPTTPSPAAPATPPSGAGAGQTI